MANVVDIRCPGGDTETVDLDLNPVIAKRIEDGELQLVEKPKPAPKTKAKEG